MRGRWSGGRKEGRKIKLQNELDRKSITLFMIIWVVQMAAAFYFCTQKQGFHEDEYYTYYSTARTNGFYVEDGQWMERDTYRDEFVVLKGQQFQYGLVKLVQSWDVHPPMYYWVFHTVASLFPDVFSKWTGLAVNLFFYGINMILLAVLAYLAGGRNVKLALAVMLFYGLTPAAFSGVVFIRMYEMLTMWVLLCAIWHVRALERQEGINVVFPAVVTYFGFLTQYYYFIFLFFMAVFFCIYLLWKERGLRNCLRYGISQAVAFALAYLTYPSCLSQMFRGQRGAQATENFFDLSNTFMRLDFFYELLDEYVFGKMLPFFLMLIVILGITGAALRNRKGKDSEKESAQEKFGIAFWLLLFTAAGYFLTVSKTALLLGDTSNRYQLPIYGIVVFIVFNAAAVLWRRCFRGWSLCFAKEEPEGKRTDKLSVIAFGMVMAGLVALNIAGLLSDRVVFLYPEDEAQVRFARKQAQTPVVYLFDEGSKWCVWDVANELFEYPAVYFAASGSTEKIGDEVIASAQELVVYLDKGADEEAQLARIFASNPNLKDYELKFEEKYCKVYYMN